MRVGEGNTRSWWHVCQLVLIGVQLCLVAAAAGSALQSFSLGQLRLLDSRFQENQARTLAYLKFVDLDRLLHVYRLTHKIETHATANGGWDAPNFPFRSHFQGHVLSAFAQCGDDLCRQRSAQFVRELAKCQAAKAGFSEGYLSGFPERAFDDLANGGAHGNVPWYVMHKLMTGLLDVWTTFDDDVAKDVLLSLAGWADSHTKSLSAQTMQRILDTEHGGMIAVFVDLSLATKDPKWLDVARRFDHKTALDPLAQGNDRLAGLHANTQLAKWVGAARMARATGDARFSAIAKNAWKIVVGTHSYAIGGNSVDEHFKSAGAIASALGDTTAESCNTYNMLKLTRELWMLDPDVKYFDYFEVALYNHMLGQQDPKSAHGHVTYFMSLGPGSRRGHGPAWGGGTWSDDYDTFWCCQGTGLETNTKYAESIYFRSDTALYVNLFIPSQLLWQEKDLKVEQTGDYPSQSIVTIKVMGSGVDSVLLRMPSWAKDPTITYGGQTHAGTPGSYFTIPHDGTITTIELTIPIPIRRIVANDDPTVAAIAFGPIVLAGKLGEGSISKTPGLDLNSVKRTGTSGQLTFTALSDGETISLVPFYDASDFKYVTYWRA